MDDWEAQAGKGAKENSDVSKQSKNGESALRRLRQEEGVECECDRKSLRDCRRRTFQLAKLREQAEITVWPRDSNLGKQG